MPVLSCQPRPSCSRRARRSARCRGSGTPAPTAAGSSTVMRLENVAKSCAPTFALPRFDVAPAEAAGDPDALRRRARRCGPSCAGAPSRRSVAHGSSGRATHGVEVDPVDLAEVDLAEDPAVVPPAARRQVRRREARRREVGRVAAVVDAHDEPVDAVALEQRRRDPDLERQVGAGVGADRLAVHPEPRPVVHRLEAQRPSSSACWSSGGGSPCGTTPIDPAIDSFDVSVAFQALGTFVVAQPAVLVVRMKRCLSPWSARVQTEQPVAAHQVAAVGAGLVEGAARQPVRGVRGRGEDGDRQEGRADGDDEAQVGHRARGSGHGGSALQHGGGRGVARRPQLQAACRPIGALRSSSVTD